MTQTPEKSKAPTPPAKTAAKDARAVAHKILLKIEGENLSLEDAWSEVREIAALEPRDRSLCRLLVLTTLRFFGFLDARISKYAKTPDKLPQNARMALRLGFAQMLFLRTPAHALVNQCVNLLGANEKVMRGLVNAILRKAAASEKPVEDASTCWKESIPAWLLNTWKKDYGEAVAQNMARAALCEPALDITVKDNAAHWAKELNATLLPTGSLRLKAVEDISALKGFAEGAWWVQDAASALPAQLAGDVQGKLVYDLCAAPGGKTAQFMARGARVVAVDQSDKRLQRLRENMQRLKFAPQVVCSDVAKFKPAEKADVVFLDAPCSATGTLRRHPDLMLRKHTSDAPRLAKLQTELLAHAAGLVKQGGLLIYAVCSLQQEEGEQVIAQFLKDNPSFKRVPISAAELGNWQEGVTKAGDLRTLPHHMQNTADNSGGMDGFYATRLQKG